MPMDARELNEWRAKTREMRRNPNLCPYKKCHGCGLYWWNRVWRQHKKACQGAETRKKYGYE